MIGNIEWVHEFFSPAGIDDRALALIPTILNEIVTPRKLSLAGFCSEIDARHGRLPGSSLMVTRHLLSTRKVICDMEHVTLNGALPISELRVNDLYQKRRLA